MLVNKVLDFPITLKVNRSLQTYCFEVRGCRSKGLMTVLPPSGLTSHFLAKPGETGINKHGVFKAKRTAVSVPFCHLKLLPLLQNKRQQLSRRFQKEFPNSLTYFWCFSSTVILCASCSGKFQRAIIGNSAPLQSIQQDFLKLLVLWLFIVS